VLQRILARAGYAVVSAAQGDDAMARVREAQFDLVITDIEMPKSDGFELIPALRRERPKLRILAISGAERVLRNPQSITALGADALLQKPVTGSELVQAVRSALARAA
jgi:CheY-like chemotaxis protein